MHRIRNILLMALLIFWQQSFSQGHLFSEVSFNKHSVYVGEPLEVSVSVFTSSWFTKGVNPGNVKINGAFTVYFRGVSTSKKIKGKTYAGVTMVFNVFPYEADELVFPSLAIHVETPDEGGYKGVSRTIKTRAKTIVVNPIPSGYKSEEWLVASALDARDHWKGNTQHVKVGDVLERNISRTAGGTVAGLIPPIIWDTIPDVSIYPVGSSADDNKTRTSISATRTDGIRYLFEKEGDVIIPAIELKWWNAYHKKLYKRTLKEITINVQANPDLGMIESLRDSLAMLNARGAGTEEEEKPFYQRLSKKQIVYLIILFIVLIYFLRHIGRLKSIINQTIKYFEKRQEKYQQSEKYFFNKFIDAAKKKESPAISKALYLWIDFLSLEEPTITHFVSMFGNETVRKEAALFENMFEGEQTKISLTIKAWKQARQNYLADISTTANDNSTSWINPGR